MNSNHAPKQKQQNEVGRNFILIEKFRKAKFVAAIAGLSLLYQLILPNVSYALTGGPATPDFSSFEPVATTNMVNEFTGQFVYNLPVLEIPGAEGGGYAMSLSYHSGDGPETESSWVGAGWTLNPGSITRAKRGLPDDYMGDSVTYYNDVPRNWTVAVSDLTSIQAYSVIGSFSNTVRYNNYKGFGFTRSFGLAALNGVASLNYHLSAGEGTYSIQVNPAQILSSISQFAGRAAYRSGSIAGRNMYKVINSSTGQAMVRAVGSQMNSLSNNYISYLLLNMTPPSVVTPFSGASYATNFSLTANFGPVQVGLDKGATISYSYQDNFPKRSIPAYGYMYSGNALPNFDSASECVMDYTVENESRYNPRDLFLPVPTSTPDAFMVSGEGIGGGFRMYHQRIGKFSPNYARSKMDLKQLPGLNAHIGWTNGAGTETSVADGEKTLTARSMWQKNPANEDCDTSLAVGNMDSFYFLPDGFRDSANEYSEPVFFRFNNDLGGKVIYDNTNYALSASATECDGPFLSEDAKLLLKDFVVPNANRSGRASHIAYNTNERIKKKHATSNKRIYAHCMDENIHFQAGRNLTINNPLDNLIGEVAVTNEDAVKYTYGLPVYAADEVSLQHGMSKVVDSDPDNYLVHADITGNKIKVGQELHSPYVSSYLLTSITTPDYIDVNLNGPDKEDFGGYTKFEYSALHQSNSKAWHARSNTWYKWRAPYQGYYFNPQRQSDISDNLGSYQSGLRENYMLSKIETKTHYAIFDPVHTAYRKDAREAALSEAHNGIGAGEHIAMKHMQALGRIRLYAKTQDAGQPDQLIKTVNFEYDYSNWPGVPNNFYAGSDNGKLTLKRVWFEYNGVYEAKLSPYEFHYQYPDLGTQYPSKYQNILNEMNDNIDQAPNYEPHIDCWGDYQYDGKQRRKKYLSSVDQTPANTYDPAAWQLKRIVLPSGGEIHVQYEQHSYAYVQDLPAQVMVSLKPSSSHPAATGNRFYLDLDDLDIDAGSLAEKQKLVQLIKKTYTPNGPYMYYKFFYTLLGTSAQSINSCNGDYVDGYGKVVNVGIGTHAHAGDIYIEFAPTNNIPNKMCKDYVRKEVGGKIFNAASCSPNISHLNREPGSGGASLVHEMNNIAGILSRAVAIELDPGRLICREINHGLSYLRIPVWNKHGGGVRVKRLLMYNKGVDAGSQSLYGTEYIYENGTTNESWGVATNEPLENREENPLITYLPQREPQTKTERLFNGRDIDQFEGPYSMNVAPQASIGYRQVIKKNIHDDRYTGTGYTVVNYYTVKDYPFYKVYPNLGAGTPYTDMSKALDPRGYVDIGLFKYTIAKTMNVAQSYCFILNEMHGQLRSIANYPGTFYHDFFNNSQPSPVTQTIHEYFEPGEMIPLYNFNTYSTIYDQPGKEMDITIDVRSVEEYSKETRITGDFTFAQVGPLSMVYPVVLPPFTSESYVSYNSMVSNKVIHYPAIMKRTIVKKDNVASVTENIGFDPLNTRPMVTRTYDSYYGLQLGSSTTPHEGVYTTTNVPASSQYPQMGQKAWNELYTYYADLSAGSALQVTSSGTTYTVQGVNTKGIFTKGDLIAIHTQSGSISMANVVDIIGVDLEVAAANRFNTSVTTGNIDKVEIIKSGYENKLTASMGGMIEYGADPPTPVTPDQLMIEMNEALMRVRDIQPHLIPYTETVYTTNLTHNLIWTDSVPLGNFDHCSAKHFEVERFEIVKESGSPNPIIWLRVYYTDGTLSNHLGGVLGFNLNYIVSILPTNITYPSGFRWDFPGWSIPGAKPLLWWRIHDQSTQNYEQLLGFFCTDPKLKGVLKASVTTYSDNWPHSEYMFNNRWIKDTLLGHMNDYEAGRKGKWRPHETFVHEDETHKGADPLNGERNYLGAGKSINFVKAPWSRIHIPNPSIWIRTNEVVAYTPNGYAFEEKDAYDVFSSAKYGYNGLLPFAIAKNAPERSYRFESFEMLYPGDTLEDRFHVPNPGFGPSSSSDKYAHTGKKYFYLNWSTMYGNPDPTPQPGITISDVLDHDGKGHIIRYWAIANEHDPCVMINVNAGYPPVASQPPYYGASPGNHPHNDTSSSWSVKPKAIARTGDWVLFEADCRHPGSVYHPTYNPSPKPHSFYAGILMTYVFHHDGGKNKNNPEGAVTVYSTPIDDIRIQPRESEMTAYVYDPVTFRVFAILDNQHFATYYQYNGEGKLIRKKLETERGIKTVEEAQYNTPKTYPRQ